MWRNTSKLACAALAVASLAGCGAANDIKDAAKGLKDASKSSQELQAQLDKAKTLTYTATYDLKDKDGKVTHLTIAQKPPKSLYKQDQTEFVDDGVKTYSCQPGDGGQQQCLELGAHQADGGFAAAGGFTFAFNPATFVGLYEAAAIVPGVDASKSTRDIAGQKSDCYAITSTRGSDKGKKFEGCTTGDGVFSFSDDGDGNVVTLTKYEKSAADSLFVLPAKPQTTQDLIDNATSTTRPSSTTSTTESSTTTTSESTTTSSEDTTTTSG
jgi:hypothetical protein